MQTVLYEVENEVIQAEFLASSIKNKLKAGVSPNEMQYLCEGFLYKNLLKRHLESITFLTL